jgi:hypothetical protein
MQRQYGRNQIPNLRKKSGLMDYLDAYYIDPKSCLITILILTVFIVSIMCVAAAPNSNLPLTV